MLGKTMLGMNPIQTTGYRANPGAVVRPMTPQFLPTQDKKQPEMSASLMQLMKAFQPQEDPANPTQPTDPAQGQQPAAPVAPPEGAGTPFVPPTQTGDMSWLDSLKNNLSGSLIGGLFGI